MSCSFSWNCPPGSFPYTVRQGDTLYSIAKRFETTVERLARINSIPDANTINAGENLCIPLPLQYFPACMTTNYYVVNENDTIESIADYFGVSTAQIIYSNIGIDADNLYNGMILCIPLAKPPVCINIENGLLSLLYPSGDSLSFPAAHNLSGGPSVIVQKQIDTSFGGRKRLNLLESGSGISSPSAQLSENDILLGEDDMDKVFNLVTVGTEVTVR